MNSFSGEIHKVNMSKRLEEFAPTLKLLAKCSKPRKQRWLDDNLNDSLILCLCECSLNILRGNVPLKPKQKKLLEKHKKCLRQLINKKISMKNKKKILQDGGFISALISPIISVLNGLLGGGSE